MASEQKAAQGKAPAVSGQKAAPPKVEAPKPQAPKSQAPQAQPGKLLASPLAKTLAIELGIDLRNIEGTGPGGRIVERDVRAAADGATGGNGKSQRAQQAPQDEAEPAHEEPDTSAKTQALAVRHARQMTPDAEGDYEDIPANNMPWTGSARFLT